MMLSKSVVPFLLFLQQATGHRNSVASDSSVWPQTTARRHAGRTTKLLEGSDTNRKGLFGDTSVMSKVRRQLAEIPATDFCSDLSSIEAYMAGRFLADFTDITLLTETGSFVCSCLIRDEVMDIVCGSMFTVDSFAVIANEDYMQLKLGENGGFDPESVGWCEYFDGSYSGPKYCEDYILSTDDPSMINECFIQDDTCTTEVPECQICEGGQTVSVTSCFLGGTVSCEEFYMGPYMYEYHVANPIKVMPDVSIGCVEDARSPEDFCADLSEIEMTITQTFRDFAPDLQMTPYECECLPANNFSFAVNCENNYLDEEANVTYLSREVMVFSPDNGYYVPSQMQFCDINQDDVTENYCETFDFAFLQDQLSYCELGDCGSAFCELCADATSYATSCFLNHTCADAIPGSFLFVYKDTKLAIEQCVPTEPPVIAPTDPPVVAPTDPPVVTPTDPPVDAPTMAPVEMPVEPPTTTSPVQDTPTTEAPAEGPTDSSACSWNVLVSLFWGLATVTLQMSL